VDSLTPRAALNALERWKDQYGGEASARKRVLIRQLSRARLRGASSGERPSEIQRLHESLCFLHAYPDDAPVLALVRRALRSFDLRADVRRHAESLASSGIAGTPTDYRFYYPTARWLASRWSQHLKIDWDEFESPERLMPLLSQLALPAEQPAVDELDETLRQWIERLRRRDETDAGFLIRRFAELPMDDAVREALWDSFDILMRLTAGKGTPSRTRARVDFGIPVHFQTAPLSRERPVLEKALAEEPRAIYDLSPSEGAELVNLARVSMVSRERDLDAFAWGDPLDVRLVDYGNGLQFAAIGMVPSHRLLLESVYGYLTLKNGVPLGYVLTSALFGSSEVAYNVFETYRGAEAGPIYGKVLAMTRHLFGSDSFTVDPYQLGHENEEGIESGAWWFYNKLGFRPRDAAVRRVLRGELARMKRRPSHRSNAATLRKLAQSNVYYHAGRERDDVLGLVSLSRIGLAATRYLSRRFGSDRARGAKVLESEARETLGADLREWSRDEREAFRRWAGIVGLLGVTRWSPAERRALVEVIRAKGGRRESDYVHRFNAHRRLRASLLRLSRSGTEAGV
jgi:hypothetical protein